jgi:hypothetical protein
VIGGEHGAEGRHHRIEAFVGKRQRLRIGDFDLERQALAQGAFPGAIQQRGHIIRRRHIAPAARRGQGGIAVSGRNIQHPLPAPQVHGLTEFFTHDLQGGTYHREVADAHIVC